MCCSQFSYYLYCRFSNLVNVSTGENNRKTIPFCMKISHHFGSFAFERKNLQFVSCWLSIERCPLTLLFVMYDLLNVEREKKKRVFKQQTKGPLHGFVFRFEHFLFWCLSMSASVYVCVWSFILVHLSKTTSKNTKTTRHTHLLPTLLRSNVKLDKLPIKRDRNKQTQTAHRLMSSEIVKVCMCLRGRELDGRTAERRKL